MTVELETVAAHFKTAAMALSAGLLLGFSIGASICF